MSQTEYYREQAERAQSLAARSSLPNVRARLLESAETWMRFVERAERLEQTQAGSTARMGRAPRLL